MEEKRDGGDGGEGTLHHKGQGEHGGTRRGRDGIRLLAHVIFAEGQLPRRAPRDVHFLGSEALTPGIQWCLFNPWRVYILLGI